MMQIFIILLLIQYAKIGDTRPCSDPEDGSTTPAPCGPYGFRCVDEYTYQICATMDSEGNVEAPELSRECFKGLVCDEESPAFCSPIDEEMVEAKKATTEIRITKAVDTHNGELFDCNGEEITSDFNLIDVETTTQMPDDDDEGRTSSFAPVEFECPGYGQYADSLDKCSYWVCDPNLKGNGFEVHHMSCGKKRIFDPRIKECITIGTTRELRDTTVPKQDLLRKCRLNRKTHRFRLKRGNCENYYLCYDSNRDVMKMQCPRYYQFSDRYSRCMPENLVDCDEQNRDDDEAEEEDGGDYELDD